MLCSGSPENPDKRYDHQGNLVDYTDEMYRRDLDREEQQACPYVFLYEDYKRTRSYYELEVMFFKSVLVIIGVLLVDHLIALVRLRCCFRCATTKQPNNQRAHLVNWLVAMWSLRCRVW